MQAALVNKGTVIFAWSCCLCVLRLISTRRAAVNKRRAACKASAAMHRGRRHPRGCVKNLSLNYTRLHTRAERVNEKSGVINLYCKGLHFICFTVGLPLFYMTMLMNCEGPICRRWRSRHMWCQTANHAGEVVCTASGGLQNAGAARRSSQDEAVAAPLFQSHLIQHHVSGV